MTVLSTGVFLGAYFCQISLGTIILSACAGYLLSTDLGGFGSQLFSAISSRNKVAASTVDLQEPAKPRKERSFLWRWGVLELLYHVVMLAVVGVIAGK